jgi:transcription initiation factor TFIIF subunit beta
MDIDQSADDKKPLASLEEPSKEEETQPDPDETLQLDSGGGKIWLVKVHLATNATYDSLFSDVCVHV